MKIRKTKKNDSQINKTVASAGQTWEILSTIRNFKLSGISGEIFDHLLVAVFSRVINLKNNKL